MQSRLQAHLCLPPCAVAVAIQQSTLPARLVQVEPAFELEADAVAAVTATRQALFSGSAAASAPSACKDLCNSVALQHVDTIPMHGKVAVDWRQGICWCCALVASWQSMSAASICARCSSTRLHLVRSCPTAACLDQHSVVRPAPRLARSFQTHRLNCTTQCYYHCQLSAKPSCRHESKHAGSRLTSHVHCASMQQLSVRMRQARQT